MIEPEQKPDLIAHLKTRRTVPSVNLGGPAPDPVILEQMLEIAVRVPDHGKLVPWRFIIFAQKDGKQIGTFLRDLWLSENADAPEDRLLLEESRFQRAPLVVGVVSTPVEKHKVPVWEQELSAGAVCLNLVHAAYAYGFSAQWLTEWYSFHKETARYFGLAGKERFAGFIHIGTPTIEPTERARPDLAKITTNWVNMMDAGMMNS